MVKKARFLLYLAPIPPTNTCS